MYTGSIIFYVFSGLLFLIIIGILLEDHNHKKIFKSIAILLPIITSLSIFANIIYNIINTNNSINFVDAAGMGIFALLASVWIGLNIYNVIDKKEFEDIKMSIDSLKKAVIKSEKRINHNIEESDGVLLKYNNELNRLKKEYRIELSKELFYDAQMDYLNGISYFIKVRERFNKCYELLIGNEKVLKGIINSYIIGTLERALSIKITANIIIHNQKYSDKDIKRLTEYSYAVKHCLEKYEGLMKYEGDYLTYLIKDAFDNYKKISDYLIEKDDNEEWLNYRIRLIRLSMDEAVERYKILNND